MPLSTDAQTRIRGFIQVAPPTQIRDWVTKVLANYRDSSLSVETRIAAKETLDCAYLEVDDLWRKQVALTR